MYYPGYEIKKNWVGGLMAHREGSEKCMLDFDEETGRVCVDA